MAINPEETETLIDRLMSLFQSNEVAVGYGENPDRWVEDNLPEGTEAADVARCMPEVGERLGGGYQENLARYNASHGATAQAATQHVTHEIAYNYNTIYQQNAFVIAGEGSNVAIVQGDGNTVNQAQIDVEFDAEHPEEWDDYEDEREDYEEGETPEYPEGETPEYPEGETPEEGETPDEGEEDPWDGEEGEEPPAEDPMGEDPMGEDPMGEDPVGDPAPPEDPGPLDPPPADPIDPVDPPAGDVPDGTEAL